MPRTKMWLVFYTAVGFGLLTGLILYQAFFMGTPQWLQRPAVGIPVAAAIGLLIGFCYYLSFKFLLRSFTWPFLRRAQALTTRPIDALPPVWESSEIDKLDEILTEALATLERLDLFSSIARDIVSTLDPERTLGHIIGTAVASLPADSGLIFLLDEESQRYTIRSSFMLALPPEQMERISFPAGEGVPGWVATQGEPLIIAQAQADERVHPIIRQRGIKSLLSAPLVIGERPLGVLNLFNREQNDAFDDNDVRLANIYADLASVALDNARLYELSQRRVAELDTLSDIGRALSKTLDVEALQDIIYQQTQRVLYADNLYLALCDKARDEISFAFRMDQGQRQPVSRRRAGNGLTEYVVRTRQPLFLCGDVRAKLEELGVDAPQREPQVWLGAPLIYSDQVLGVLSVQHYQDPNAFDRAHLRLLQAIANQAAIALHNARLYKEIQDQHSKLAAILNDTTDIVVVLDQSDRVLLLNPAAEQGLEVQAAQAIGQPLDWLGVDDLTIALEAAQQAQAPIVREVAAPGERTLYASVSPVQNVGWVMVMQDVSPLKELDRLRTEWVAAVSHDLKNPITAVELSVDLLERVGPLNEQQQQMLDSIQRGSQRLRSLVTDILDLARLEAGPALRLSAVKVADVVAEALTEVEALAADKGISLSTDLPPDLPPARGDTDLLSRALVNLLSNAVKYTPEAGRVVVRARPHDGMLQIEVSDTGRGIPAEALPHVFDRFYRVPGSEEAAEGSGLGLSTVKSIVEKHGGRIWVESDGVPGQGSTFYFAVPVAKRG